MKSFSHFVGQVFGPSGDAQTESHIFRHNQAVSSKSQRAERPGRLTTLFESRSIELRLAYPGLVRAIDAVQKTVSEETIGTPKIRHAVGLVALGVLELSEELGQISLYMSGENDAGQK